MSHTHNEAAIMIELPIMFSPTAPDYIVKLRETLLRHGTFVDEHDRYTLAQDCTFENCPIRDEPGEEVRFQYNVSLGREFDSNTG